MLKSYYEILDVSPSATKSEIKSKFKKLVKMYHPDVNSSLEAEEIFKEINRAVEVLLDDEKRKKYDLLRGACSSIYNNSYQNNNRYSNFSDFFKKQKNSYRKDEPFLKKKCGEDITVNVEIDYTEAILGTQRSVNISSSVVCPKCLGRKYANNHSCEYCGGLGEKITNRKIKVVIPKGLKNGTKLRIKGEGREGKNGGENGNLYVVVKIKQKENFTIKDGTIYSNIFISPYIAILGGNVPIKTLWGQAIIKIPPLTKTNQCFKLIDVGLFDENNNKKGEQVVKVIIQIPDNLSDEEIQLYEKIRDLNLKKKNAKTIYNEN